MTRMVTFEERVWTITTQPRVTGGARATGEQDAVPHMGGLSFVSDKGDKYFLPLEGRQLPTDKKLHALSLDRVADFMKRARRARSPNSGGGEANNVPGKGDGRGARAPARASARHVVPSAHFSERTLTPAQLKRELLRIAWGQARLAQNLGVWPSEVRDWLAGKEPVPQVVASDIRRLPSHKSRHS